MKGFFDSSLKSNPSMELALITGTQALPIQSLLADIRLINHFTNMDNEYALYYGLSRNEVESACHALGIEGAMTELENNNDIYRSGHSNVFSPLGVWEYLERQIKHGQ